MVILIATPISLNGTYSSSARHRPTVYPDDYNRADCEGETIVIMAKRVKPRHRDSLATMSFDSCVEDVDKAACASIVCYKSIICQFKFNGSCVKHVGHCQS